MSDLDLVPTDGVEIEVSLDQAQHFISRLKDENKSGDVDPWDFSGRRKNRTKSVTGGATTIDVSNVITMSQTFEEFEQRVYNMSKNVQAKFDLKNKLTRDVMNFKDAIHHMNATTRIDKLLSERDYLTGLRNSYKMMLENINPDANNLLNLESVFLVAKKMSYSDRIDNNVTIYEKEYLTEKINTLNRRLTTLAGEIKRLNATTKVKVCISKEAIDILGL